MVHTQQEFSNLSAQNSGLPNKNKYYVKHIKALIGHPDMEDKNQLRVRYVKDKLAYEDVRFAGNGLIEYF